jgi:WD40 repeat protein
MLPICLLFAYQTASQPSITQAAEPVLKCRVQRKVATTAGAVICFANDTLGKFIYTGHRKGVIQQWDKNWKLQHTFKDLDNIQYLALSTDGQILAASNGGGIVRVWETENWSQVNTILCADMNYPFALSPNGKLVATFGRGAARANNAITIWAAETGLPIHELSLPKDTDSPGQFSQDSSTFVTPDMNQFILWNTHDWTSKSIPSADRKNWGPVCIQLSPDERLAAVWNFDMVTGSSSHSSISIYSFPDFKLQGVIDDATLPLAFAPNSDRLVFHNASYGPKDMDWCMVNLKNNIAMKGIPVSLDKQQISIKELPPYSSGKKNRPIVTALTFMQQGSVLVFGTTDGFIDLIPLDKWLK